ncbi:type VI secretion ATPase, ClpV1 family [Sphingomonas sp. S17]|uniref:Type VI secretion system ATPase TssH n=2 Tax=Sphingomonas paucimobilis TaxID=13689 RepID=A0A7T3A7G7_SPHPI|nr:MULTISPECIES: type VI secretion system ATPase TssH [Sphingomonas]EGI55301.1 type VI secretion ATPase, ClpV1 family [Sphingomonas sp. S17]MDG5971319.1 type VI secretion system ATPase TssH [Sphingomonas paucimobilis]QPS15893.1 type VI secretion system ATPase TssH [Sphingomonas paucimobilis]QPT07346.1 type VI secretion system ATPase TssH [Sphingomonas paucimobilis]SUJ09989.1 protein disaggregation chaperone [Sphingomonas paucimobilis]
MTEISRASLFGRLDTAALTSIESATGFARMRGNPYVELVHWIHLLVQDAQGDVAAIRRTFGLDDAKLARDVVGSLDILPRGASAISDFAPQIEEAIEKGWLYASLQFGAAKIRTGHLIYGMLRTPTLRNALFATSNEWRKVEVERLGAEFAAIVGVSAEPDEAPDTPMTPAAATGEALARYSVDLTAKARAGEIDAIVGRDAEIRQLIDVLLRRRQNNPILVGEAGVGKTAVVEGFARRIVDGDVPPALRHVTVRALDVTLMQAGAGVKGEFEKRLRQVIDEVEGAATPVILFIDEAHMLIGAGGQAGTGDAANLLKPALARGRLRTIAATTYAEYRQYFEKDPALTRRFQTVDVAEPEAPVAIAMLRSVVPAMEAHHDVVILDDAVAAAVTLSQRYVPARQLPDKAVSLIDTAAARVAVSQNATPAPVEDQRRRLALLEVERGVAEREIEARYRPSGDLSALDDAIAEAREAVEQVEAKWAREKAALEAVRSAREKGGDALDVALAEARAAAGDAPMVFGVVDADAIASVVGDWTGIPVGRMVKDEIASVLKLADALKARVVGQDHAMEAIAKRIQTSRAKLDNPGKPVGVFMLCGPSGVGKTETAHALSELLFSGDDSMIVINMSEFQEAHTVSTLKGAPAGYVGYGQGGVLTEAVRRRPYSVVLLDEVEKAHPDVHEMFFQVFDKGFMNDAEGRHIDFRNTVILLTSNVGTDLIATLAEDEEMAPEPEGLATALRPELLKVFPPALLGRLQVLPYYPLSKTVLAGIVRLQLGRIERRIADNHGIAVTIDPAVVDHIVERCTEIASGGRMIDAILTNTMLPDMSVALLARKMRGEEVAAIAVEVEEGRFTYSFDPPMGFDDGTEMEEAAQ